MPLINMKQVQGGKELQGNVNALLDIIGKDKDAFFNEILNWLLAEAPQDFNPEILKSSKLAMLVSSAVMVNNEEPEKPYLSFIEENGESFTLRVDGDIKTWDGTMYYSTDGETWDAWSGEVISSSSNGKLFIRGKNNTRISHDGSAYKTWVLSVDKHIQCQGNIENLLDYEVVEQGNHPEMAKSCCSFMFNNCTSLVKTPELPATTLAERCYTSMFNNCTSLTKAPELPATTLADYCYSNMFGGCTSLTKAPELPATTLAKWCYNGMFNNCTNLTTAPSNFPATTVAGWCYYRMFYNCTSLTGTIHCPASTASEPQRLDTAAAIPDNTATVVYDL